MSTLENKVREVVKSLLDKDELFTALDVSNAVKVSMPLARHGEVRDFVRGMYGAEMSAANYSRTPIEVILEDGSKTEALLYHPLYASWDIATKYDDQRRAAKAANPVAAVTVAPISATITVKKPAAQITAAPAAPTAVATPKQLWDNLFSPTRLFPKF